MADLISALLQAPLSVILVVLGVVFLAASLIKIQKTGWVDIPDENRRLIRIFGGAMMAVGILLFVYGQKTNSTSASGIVPVTGETAVAPGQPTGVSAGPTPYQDWKILLVDNFNNNDSSWPLREIDDANMSGNRTIENGVYHWDLTSKFDQGGAYYAFPRRSDTVSDFRVKVYAYVKERSAPVRYGLIFRHSPEQNSHYAFAIDDEEGTYGVSIFLNGSWSPIIKPKGSSAIKSDKPNQLAVIGQGSHFYLYINDRLVDEFTDSQLKNGQAGVALTSLPFGKSVTLEFDNFELSTPIQ